MRSLSASSGPRFIQRLRCNGGSMSNTSPLYVRDQDHPPLKKAVFKSPFSNKRPSLTIHCKIADSPSDVRVGDDVEKRCQTRVLKSKCAQSSFWNLLCSNVLTRQHPTGTEDVTSWDFQPILHQFHCFFVVEASRYSRVRVRSDTSTRRFSGLTRSRF